MAEPARKKTRKQVSGSRVVSLVILFLVVIIIVSYFIISPSNKADITAKKSVPSLVKPIIYPSLIPHVAVSKPPAVSLPPEKNPLTISPPQLQTLKPSTAKSAPALLAIIIDDMGSSLSEASSLVATKVPLTFAIIPGLRHDKEVAEYAYLHKIETMIHIPMQSKGWPVRHLEANGLLVSMDTDELKERVAFFLKQFPRAVGVNNHMGSEFTEQEEKISAVLYVLKMKNLFFIDSVTSPESAGFRIAQQLGVKSARRNVFLDNEQERSYIRGQLNQAVKLAKKNGSAIAICHPHTVTISTLVEALPELASQGINLVPVSQLVK